jgi:lipopolysaccharide/colanic/teichoic acid biosynthesis glycosyltransferase
VLARDITEEIRVPLAGWEVVANPSSVFYLAAKRVLDCLIAASLLIVMAPVIGLFAILIRLDSRGPALFRQARVGRHGRLFTIYKLRTMSSVSPIYSYKVPMSDPRITRVGRWLRRSGLDELPQLWNVFRGDMSLVGPRPEQPFIVDGYQEWQHRRHSIRPGITGWWQIHHRNEVPMHLNLDYDMYYLANISPRLDWQIAARTVRIILSGLFTSVH